jgi:rhodanese-related sulfurtransferase
MKRIKITVKKVLLTLALVFIFSQLATHVVNAQVLKSELPKDKQTTTGLYVTAREAYDMWKNNPEKVKILDVRTQEEYYYLGHPAMAWNIPMVFTVYGWDAEKKDFLLKPNPDFMKQIKATFQPGDIILITCRSGGRSAIAVNQLTNAGFKNVYNITDGFEGDMVKDANSVFVGQRMVNGWKNSGIPWTYTIDPKLMLMNKAK